MVFAGPSLDGNKVVQHILDPEESIKQAVKFLSTADPWFVLGRFPSTKRLHFSINNVETP